MANPKYGRHLPAFILLFLTKGSTYGSALLNRMKEEMPYNFSDGPAVYRALNELEKEEAVIAQWDTSAKGAAKKCYTITDKGMMMLTEFRKELDQLKKNMEYFLSEFDKIEDREENQ
ncbi:PadR family transcriptional regulator [Acetobacterium bakii]|uniref:PadR family transcriptional regulator n=1 Tax=Acetobacterium bakii TaxID=52689 RepID=A0A0L6TZ96_9FIRM|nr:helix-turn-helix transcriptional regulator [Acetobacterium bakii]KNZ40870.1 PadR family transcriptional regulator [Acetobacterium bakii]